MSILCAEKMERVMRELVEGEKHATELRFLFQQNPINAPHANSVSVDLAEPHLDKIHRSFAEAISVLALASSPGGGENGSHVGPHSSSASEGSTESRKRPPGKDGRGSYRRRKSEETWSNVSQNTEDNHAWRKYGQKEILNSKFPRSYFRCTRKYDQGCRATKQVQQTQQNPVMYQITYIGLHTCKDSSTLNLKAQHILAYPDDESNLVNNIDQHQQEYPPTRIIKQEYPKEDTQSDHIWSELKDLKNMPSDHKYSCSGGGSHQTSLDLDFGVFDSSDFCTDFHFGDHDHDHDHKL